MVVKLLGKLVLNDLLQNDHKVGRNVLELPGVCLDFLDEKVQAPSHD